ncbi:zinc finger BED domain-containing protein RICESLEEPER 2-like, partial [Dorcoceras hygrometricum]
KVSLTTDMWKSKNQNIKYMIVTEHWINSEWKLQKRVLGFLHIPPPRRDHQISDAIFKCVKYWGIQNKVFSISVDNASNNDSAIRLLKDNFSRAGNLLGEEKLFYVGCCAHVLNLMVQDGLTEIMDITQKIRESVYDINRSYGRIILFSEIVQQLRLPGKKLIHDCRTRWNSTYEMLSCALKFREVFPQFAERDAHYDCCPNLEDWEKVEKVCSILQYFWSATQIISGSEYPTSNLFFKEVQKIKVMLDRSYRASLAPETVQVLMCAGDWCRCLHGVKKKTKGGFYGKFKLYRFYIFKI